MLADEGESVNRLIEFFFFSTFALCIQIYPKVIYLENSKYILIKKTQPCLDPQHKSSVFFNLTLTDWHTRFSCLDKFKLTVLYIAYMNLKFVLLNRCLTHRGTSSWKSYRCRMRTASCRTARAATARGTRRIANARGTNVIHILKFVWRNINREFPRLGLAVSELDLRPFSVGINFRPRERGVKSQGLFYPSVLLGRWVDVSPFSWRFLVFEHI